MFHGVLLERRKFGALGFNIPYEYTDGDLNICISQLKMFLLEYKEIPYKVDLPNPCIVLISQNAISLRP
jgi:dynein heavy chain